MVKKCSIVFSRLVKNRMYKATRVVYINRTPAMMFERRNLFFTLIYYYNLSKDTKPHLNSLNFIIKSSISTYLCDKYEVPVSA